MECAERLARYFAELRLAYPALSHWYQVGIPKKRQEKAGCVSDYDLTRLAALMKKGVNRRDVPPREIIPELGFRVSLYDRRRGDACTGLRVHCGSWFVPVPNCVILDVPTDPEQAGLKANGLVDTMFRLGRDIWGADKGSVFVTDVLEPAEVRQL